MDSRMVLNRNVCMMFDLLGCQGEACCTAKVHEGTDEVLEGTAQEYESTAGANLSTAEVYEGTAQVNEGTAQVNEGTAEVNESTAEKIKVPLLFVKVPLVLSDILERTACFIRYRVIHEFWFLDGFGSRMLRLRGS
ncbi:hypothetical protein Tco_0778902 [Tanacetum coccineum]